MNIMAVINEKLIDDEYISFKWEFTLSNGITGKNIIIGNTETNYIISKNGKVYNIKTEKELKPFIIKNCGYLAVNIQLGKRGKYKTMPLHRLIGLGWIPNKENKPIINHKDGNKLNINIDNLEWSTYSENNKHAFDNQLKIPSHVNPEKCNLTKHTMKDVIAVCEYLQMGYSPKAIHKKFNIDYDFSQKIYTHKTWKNISLKYDFSKVILYNKNFTFQEVEKIMKLYKLNFDIKQISELMNWEYNKDLRNKLKKILKQVDKYIYHEEAQVKLL